ncbi:MAG: efflux RND transporter periplasmic adaptor subunit [Deltaproteobacteria bacterium]|nr:MAG: efflux RND transporter periplasmic adaptor subunit [Deltaproteobacteria bacterium]
MIITAPVKSIALVLLLGGTLLTTGCSRQDAAPAPAPPPEVGVITLQPQRAVLTTELPGRVAPHLVAEVRPQVGGIIQQRLFAEGSEVRAGQALYQIDPATYRAAFASARAALSRAEANLAPARLKAERFRELVAIKAVSQQEDDDAQAALLQAAAEVESARAAVETARINLDYTGIKAPISGRIGRSTVTTGALVTANQPAALATIQQLDPVYVDVTQSTAELLRLKESLARGLVKGEGAMQAPVRLRFENGTLYPLTGTLKFAEVTVDQSTGSVTLRTLFPNPEQLLLPGMFVRAVLEEGVSEQALLVPQRGVTRDPAGRPMAFVVGADDKVEPRVIKASRTIGDSWLVEDGLKAGDRVILEGIQRARPGTVVRAVPFGSPPGGGAPAPAPAAEKKP